LLLDYHRLALSWQARGQRGSRAVKLRRDCEFIQVSDGARTVHIPDIRGAKLFSGGIGRRLAAVAAKYTGGTGYVPREGDLIVDVGAGIGEFTLWCADAGARVVAFEPDPLAFACLQRNVHGRADIQVFPYALWKERADLRLHGSADTSESSLIENGSASARTADVEAWPLDALPVVTRLPVIDFMKVDGEGVEPEILAGGGRTLRRTRAIAVDIGSSDRRPNLRARVEAALESLLFRPLPHDRGDTILALNTAMVGPFSNRALDRRSS
jgi:FkbM family methyltransferase